MLTFFIFTLCAYICFAANYDIIWDQNYCVDKDRYPDTYKLPHNSPCSLCFDDVITLRINSTSNIYENLYRVPTETAMMDCNATVNINDNVFAFNNTLEINIRSGGSDSALSFLFQAEPYYFISTSNGTQTSAENDLVRSPNSCLQLAFTVRLNSDASCGNYTANCDFTTVFTDPPSLLQCLQPTTTHATPTILGSTSSTTTTTPTPTVTQVNTQRLEINLERFVSSPLSTVIPLCVLIVIIAILIIILPSVFIPVLVLYARGIICGSKGSQDATQPSSRFNLDGSSLDTLTKSPLDLENLYLPPFPTQSKQADTNFH